MKYDVFVSYSRKDNDIVREILKLLDANSITYWLDTKKIGPGSEFMADIVEAIENSKIFLVFLHDMVYDVYDACKKRKNPF